MKYLNRVMLVGNLGRDASVKFSQSGSAICSLSIATTKSWKDDAGEWQDRTEWHNLVAFGKLAESLGECTKGETIYAEGELQTRSYTAKDGAERKVTEIVVSAFIRHGRRDSSGQGDAISPEADSAPAKGKARPIGGGYFDDLESDVPF